MCFNKVLLISKKRPPHLLFCQVVLMFLSLESNLTFCCNTGLQFAESNTEGICIRTVTLLIKELLSSSIFMLFPCKETKVSRNN